MDNLDEKIYGLIAECCEAELPFVFCGSDPAQKWELVSLLKAYLKKSKATDRG